MAQIAVPRGLVLASGFLSALLEDTLTSEDDETIQFERCTIPEIISDKALANTIEIFKALPGLTPDAFSEGSVNALPELLATSSFLQIQLTTDFLVQVLNYLAKIDDPRLTHLTGPINIFWIGDQAKLNTAAKVWLGLIKMPITAREEDSSCYSSIKFLIGKQLNTTLLTLMTYNNTDQRCAALLDELDKMYVEYTFKPYLTVYGEALKRDPDFYKLLDYWVKNEYFQTQQFVYVRL
jgi:hypothetical protein